MIRRKIRSSDKNFFGSSKIGAVPHEQLALKDRKQETVSHVKDGAGNRRIKSNDKESR